MIVVERDMQARYAREAEGREAAAQGALEAARTRLRARYADDDEAFFFRRGAGAGAGGPAPCAEAKQRTVECYRQHGADAPAACAGVVADFVACARGLQG